MKLAVFGCELTGLVTASSFAFVGNEVLSIPVEEIAITDLQQGNLPYDEPGLESLMLEQLKEGRLRFTADWQEGLKHAEVIVLSMPSWRQDKAEELIDLVGKTAKKDVLVVNQSTFPIGTSDRFEAKLNLAFAERGLRAKASVLALPDFVSEGSALGDFMKPARIILGGSDQASLDLMRDLLRPFNNITNQIKIMSTRAAEYTKYAVNALLATRVSLINELANNAEHFDVDFEEVRQGLGSDSRIGFNYLFPGCGFGGPRFAADVELLVSNLQEKGYDADLLRTVLSNNDTQKEVLFRKAWRFFNTDLRNIKIAVWGLAFKANVSTVENAPSLKALEAFAAQGAQIVAYDPKAMEDFQKHWTRPEQITMASDMYSALEGADALLILTEWKMFWSPDYQKMQSLMKRPVIFDGRNIFDPQTMRNQGFRYFGVGRGEVI